MCSSCGCGDYTHQHPHSHSIIWQQIVAAAKDADISPHQVAENIMDAADHTPDSDAVAKGWVSFVSDTLGSVEGRVLKASEEDQFLLMVIYSPNRMPLRGADQRIDVASPRVLEKACWSWMAKGAKTGLWHEDGHDHEATTVENYIYRNPIPWDIHGDGSLLVKEGDWVGGFQLSDRAWSLYKSDQIGGASMQGGAGRMEASEETLERIRSNA